MFSGARVGAFPKTVVDMELTAASITEIPTLDTAEVFEPVFRFDKDFGHGTELWPLIEDGTRSPEKISTWICKELGYGSPIKTTGSRVQPYEAAIGYMGNPEVAGGAGLRIVPTAKNTALAAKVVCHIKKNTETKWCKTDEDCAPKDMCVYDICM